MFRRVYNRRLHFTSNLGAYIGVQSFSKNSIMETLEILDMGAYIALTRHITYASLIKHIGSRWLDND